MPPCLHSPIVQLNAHTLGIYFGKSLSEEPKYLDVPCGKLAKIVQYQNSIPGCEWHMKEDAGT